MNGKHKKQSGFTSIQTGVAKEKAAKRQLAQMDLIEDFLITTLMSHPEYGERFGKILLQRICGVKVQRLTIIPQKVYYGSKCWLSRAWKKAWKRVLILDEQKGLPEN